MNKLLLSLATLGFALNSQAQNNTNQSQFEQHKAKMWSAVDINHDDKITRQEALSKASELFDRQDLNKDGLLTRNEIQNSTILKPQKKQKNLNKKEK